MNSPSAESVSDAHPELTLNDLPPEILRRIIQVDDGESIDQMQRLNKTWNVLVMEYRAILSAPPIDRFAVRLIENDLKFELTVETKYYNHFKWILPNGWKLNKLMKEYGRRSPNVQKTHVEFAFLLEGKENMIFCLNRLFVRTQHVNKFVITRIDQNMLKTIWKTMRRIKIDDIEVNRPPYFLKERNTLIPMIQRHRVDSFTLFAEELDEAQDMREFIQTISDTASIVHINFSCDDDMFTTESLRFWNSCGRTAVKKGKRLSCLRMKADEKIVCAKRSPFLKFMQKFAGYDY